jgi:hypothetical protein
MRYCHLTAAETHEQIYFRDELLSIEATVRSTVGGMPGGSDDEGGAGFEPGRGACPPKRAAITGEDYSFPQGRIKLNKDVLKKEELRVP